MNKHFDISRFWLLLKIELFKGRKMMVLTFLIIFNLLFFVSFLLSIYLETPKVFDHTESYPYALIAGGFIVSSLAFSDLGNQLRRYRFLTLPVSVLERFTCMWLLSSFGWLILFTVSYTLYTWFATALGHGLFPHVTIKPFEPLGAVGIGSMKSYIVLQGMFLLGATHFRTYVFAKMVIAIAILITLCGGTLFLLLKEQFLADHYCTYEGECGLIDAFMVHPVWYIAKWFFFLVLAPLTWILTYLGLKEFGT